MKQTQNDAVVLVIETAIEKYNRSSATIVVGEEVDLLVLITATKGREGATTNTTILFKKFISLSKMPKQYFILHATTGCYTTSAMFRRGKKSVLLVLSEKQKRFD